MQHIDRNVDLAFQRLKRSVATAAAIESKEKSNAVKGTTTGSRSKDDVDKTSEEEKQSVARSSEYCSHDGNRTKSQMLQSRLAQARFNSFPIFLVILLQFSVNILAYALLSFLLPASWLGVKIFGAIALSSLTATCLTANGRYVVYT